MTRGPARRLVRGLFAIASLSAGAVFGMTASFVARGRWP